MKRKEKMKRLLAMLLAFALAWSGTAYDSGLLTVHATETDETVENDSSDSSQDNIESETGEETESNKEEAENEAAKSDEASNEDETATAEKSSATDAKTTDAKTSETETTDAESEAEKSTTVKEKTVTEVEEEAAEKEIKDSKLLTNKLDSTEEEECEHEYEYTSNKDGKTHKVTCKNCDYEATEDCKDEDNDGICDLCKQELEVEEDEDTTELKLLADFDFENAEDDGDLSSKDAKASGSYDVIDSYGTSGSAIELDGSGQYLEVTDSNGDSLLTGLDSVSIAADVYFERSDTDWLFYSAPNKNSQTYSKEYYIGAFQNGSKLNVERYKNGRVTCPSPSLSTNGWYHVDIVFDTDNTYAYVNGEMLSSNESSFALEDILGDNSIFYIGKANWGSGEYCKAKIDNFQIYSGALSQDDVTDLYNNYLDRKAGKISETELSLNVGYVTSDIDLLEEWNGNSITWTTSDSDVVTSEGKITRTSENKEATLTANFNDGENDVEKEFKLVVLKEGSDVATYVSNSPATGQTGGMKIAKKSGDGFEALHKNQPIMYTTIGNTAYSAPTILREKEGESFYMVAADGGAGELILYTTEDLITYENETTVSTGDVSNINKIYAVYDLTDERYEFYLGTSEGSYFMYSQDMTEFSEPVRVNFDFATLSGAPSDAVYAQVIGLTSAEYDKVVEKYTNPTNTSKSAVPTEDIVVPVGTTDDELKVYLEEYLKGKTVDASYSDGTDKTYSLRFTEDSIDNVNTKVAGTYKLTGVVGGSANFTDAKDYLIAERADPFVTYNEDDGYYYFTASYPMDYSGDPDGYDRIVLRRAKTIAGLSDADEITIWDENESGSLGRFIWAPEMHKIGDSWYLIATAGLNTGSGTTFNIRPFMIKFEGDASSDDMLNPSNWGSPELVKAYDSDNILNGMSLDMTYMEDEKSGKSYLIWADETKNSQNPKGTSYLFIAEIGPSNPTQLTSEAKLLTKPEYSWEKVNIAVNEGPGVFYKNGKIYMTYSASATGSEYCVGLMYADMGADLLDASNWTKLPYPILTSADFDDEVSGPGHNSFTYDENGNLVIVYHARITAEHATHSGDPLYDPCRNAYVKSVFFDVDGLPVFNMSSDDFISGGDTFNVNLIVDGESISNGPILEYNFDETFTSGVVADSSGNGNDGTLVNGATYVDDDNYGQVLYLDGSTSFGGTNSYLQFPDGVFDDKEELTISFDVNQVTRSGNYFTFALGSDDSKYLFYKALATGEKLAITKTSYNNEKTVETSSVYPNTSRVWINIKIVVSDGKISLYRDGKLIGTNKTTGISLEDLGDDLVGYLGKSFYSSDTYFRGYFDNVKIYDTAFTESEIETQYALEQADLSKRMSDPYYVANSYVIPDMDAITGNISLPSNINGVSVRWVSSNEDVISTQSVANDNYDSTPAGVVTRQSEDTDVKLTAYFTKGDDSYSRIFHCTVKAAPKADDDYVAYLFVHFVGTQETADCEQVYFSVSKDGLNWTDLNNNTPVLTSTIGESGLRDMYIARSAEGDKFYMISTDLSIYHYGSWSEAGSNGSHSIVVWESTDLVNWSKPWLAEISPENAGCTWAPEFIYDDKTGEYIVYWASTTLEVDGDENITQEYENHTIYYSKTRDFVHFTDPKVYHEGGTDASGKIIKVIDSTMIQGNDGRYYRYTKNESVGSIAIDVSDSVLGDFEPISSSFLSNELVSRVGAVEGPIIFKLNEQTEDGQDQWCLLSDRYARSEGYYPVVTTDLASGNFEFLDDIGSFEDLTYRHGYVMPITASEYTALTNEDWEDWDDATEITLDKSDSGNPMLGFDENGDILYGGDPSILVDGNTVYAYVGHDTSTSESYNMPDWRCYSSTNMTDWSYEGEILNNADISWANDAYSAWAGQVVKYGDKYYFYYCTEAKKSYGGGKCIGVAVSDNPTGGFVDIGSPLVRNVDTYNGVSTWEDIDPTFWIETDEEGVEHRILGWGNVRFFNCELNEDMISIKDKDGDESTISCEKADSQQDADIKVGVINGMPSGHQYTEAPYYYKHTLADGTERYYMFFAYDWREQMAYAYCDSLKDFLNNQWTFGGVVMEPSATANTNHMAVFDFKGHTYFVYHDGSLAYGSGFRRVACVEEFEVNDDGSIPYIKKTATGLTGTLSSITDLDGNYIYVESFENSLSDSYYPMTGKAVGVDYYQDGEESEWEINPGKTNKLKDCYVSIESNYKPGMYLTVGDINEDGTYNVVLSQDVKGTATEAKAMTFRTILGLTGEGVTFESVLYHGYYLASVDGDLILTDSPEDAAATFNVNTISVAGDISASKGIESAHAEKTTRMYVVGETVATNDIRVIAKRADGKTVVITEGIELSVPKDTTSTAGTKKLTVTYEYAGEEYTTSVNVQVVDKKYR